MHKKNLSLLTLLTAVVLLGAPPPVFSGSYIGSSFGYAQDKIKPKLRGQAPSNTLYGVNNLKGMIGGVHFGWEKLSGGLLTAAEIGCDFTTASKKVAPQALIIRSYKVKKGIAGDLAVKTGYAFGGVIPYIRMGITGTRWSQKVNSSKDKKTFMLGFAPGMGVIAKIGGHWSTGVEYKYVLYGTYDLNMGGGNKIRIHPQSHDVRARLSYHL